MVYYNNTKSKNGVLYNTKSKIIIYISINYKRLDSANLGISAKS